MNETHHGRFCPTSEQLAAFIDRGLPEMERRVVAAHLVICKTCRQLVVAARFLHDDVEATPAQ